jgi:hypothetical protein
VAKKIVNTRRYWIVPGDVDSKGQPVKYASPPKQDSKGANVGSAGLPVLGGGSPSTAIEYMEQVFDDGDVVISRYDPEAKEWVQEDVQVDTARRGAFESDRAVERQAAEKPKSADEARKEKADADAAEAAAKIKAREAATPPPKPETITRPVQGGYGAVGSATGQTESVSLPQATYDFQSREQVISHMNEAARLAQEAAKLSIAEKQFTAAQAMAEYNKKLDRIKLEGEEQMRALTQRGQDISVRGQDISAGVSQRGQNLDYETSLAGQSTSMANAMLPYLNAPGQIASTNSLMGGGPPVPTQPMAPPFDPATFPQQAALAARGQMPNPYVLPGAPPQVPTASSYRLPG